MNFIHSITFRFTIWYLVVLAALLLALSAGVYGWLSRGLHQNMDDDLRVRTTQLQSVRGVLDSIGQGSFEEDLGEVVVLYFEQAGTLRSISPKDVDLPLEANLVMAAIEGEASFDTVHTANHGDLRVHVVPFSEEDPAFMPGRPGMPGSRVRIDSAALAVGRSTSDIDDALRRLRRILMLAIPFTLVIAGAGGVFLARRALKPVDQIGKTALEIEETDLSRRIPVTTKDELGRLSSTLNQMIDRLERAFNRQQQFTGDASHELRTPLSVIEAESTLALQRDRSDKEYRQSLETIAQEAKHMAVIIDQLLALARADSGKAKPVFTEVNLGQVIDEVVSDIDVLCREKGLDLSVGEVVDLKVSGDAGMLRQLFVNLLSNAIRYTEIGGKVSVSMRGEGRTAVVDITDTGIGIPQEEIPHVFERFYRVDKARSRAEGGSGLGLAICKHIAEAHGGTIEVQSQVGKSSTFSVQLPTG